MRAKTFFRRCYCFDLDDTLIKTPAKIRVYKNGSFVKSLTPKEYNFYKHQPGDKLDFKDFLDGEMILNAKKYTVWPVIQNISNAVKQKRSTSDIYILTARDSTVKSYIYEFLKRNGIEITIDHIITLGDNKGQFDIADEKRNVLLKLKSKYDELTIFDDNPKTIELAKTIVGIKTKLVENKKAQMKAKLINELMGTGASPGIGNIAPASAAATTGAQMSSPLSTGSGDKFDNTVGKKLYTQSKIKKKKPMKKKKLEEENINPYDKLGTAMAKKIGIKSPFKKKKDKKNQNAMIQNTYEHEIITFDEYMNESVFETSVKKGFYTNIEQDTLDNDNFRHVVYTGEQLQLVLMTLQPGEDIGEEVHNDTDQFFRFDAGNGKCIINGHEYNVKDGDCVIIPAGSKHNIINSGTKALQMYTIYAPPHHQDGIIQQTKKEADLQDKEFNGQTTE